MGQPSCRASKDLAVATRRAAGTNWEKFFPSDAGMSQPFCLNILQKQDLKMPSRRTVSSQIWSRHF